MALIYIVIKRKDSFAPSLKLNNKWLRDSKRKLAIAWHVNIHHVCDVSNRLASGHYLFGAAL